MAEYTLNVRMRHARKPETTWTSENPVLLQDEIGFVKETGRFKIGNGTTAWNSLSYATVDPIAHSATLITSGTLDSNRLPTVPVSKGGTGATTTKGASYNLFNNMNATTSEMSDTTLFVFKYVTPSADNGSVYTRTANYVWNYLNGKISSILGLTATTYGGTAAKATQDGSGNVITSTYLKLTGGTVTGTTTFSTSSFGTQLWVERSGSTNMAALGFKNSNGALGYIAMNTKDGSVVRYKASDTSTNYPFLDSGNFFSYALPLAGGTMNAGASITIPDNASYNSYFKIKNATAECGVVIYSEGIDVYAGAEEPWDATSASGVYPNYIYSSGYLQAGTYLTVGTTATVGTTLTVKSNAYFKAATNYFYNGSNYTAINRPSASANYTLYLPSATGQFVYHTNDTPIGGTGAPVYIAATGAATLVTSVAIGYGGTGATTVAGARGNLGAMAAISANNYYGMGAPDGSTNVWIRTTSLGILPYQSGSAGGGHGSLGTSSWYFSTAYIDNVYGYFNGNLSGTAAYASRLVLPRVKTDVSYQPGNGIYEVKEFDSGSTNLPSAHWYHVFTGQGSDANYNTQLALGMTTEQIHYRYRSGGTWGSWHRVYASNYHPLADTSYAVFDKTNTTTKITFNYGASGLSTTSWFAAWNGYELRGISPANALTTIKALPLAGGTMTGTICLNRIGSTSYGRLSFYSPSFYTWFEYMSDRTANTSPTGGTPPSLGGVTSWARRSLIENVSGYGWTWESCTNTSGTTPTAIMSLSSYNGLLNLSGYIRINSNSTSTSYRLYVNGSSYFNGAITSSSYIKGTYITLTNTQPFVFHGVGTGTYQQGVMYCSSSGITFETPRATESSSGTVLGFYVNTRGGSRAPLYCGNLNVTGSTSISNGLSVTGNVTITNTLYPVIYFRNSTNTCYSMFEGSYTGAANLWAVGTSGENYRRAIAVYNPQTRTDLKNAVTLRMCNAGAWTEYNILHTGHFSLNGTTLTITTA